MKYLYILLAFLWIGSVNAQAVGGVSVSASGGVLYVTGLSATTLASVAPLDQGIVSTTVSGTYTVSLSTASLFYLTPTNNSATTLTFSGAPASGYARGITMYVKQGGTGSNTLIWPASVKWSGAASPTLSTSATAIDVINFMSVDQGSTWQGFLSGVDMK